MSHSVISLGLGLGGGKSATSSGAPAGGGGPLPPLIIYTITNTGSAFYLRSSGTVDYTVDWGDGSAEEASTSNALLHTYAASGTYTINVSSDVAYRPYFANSGATGEDQITSVEIRDGINLGTTFSYAWQGAQNMTAFVASSATSTITSFDWAWQRCQALTSFSLLDTSSGTNFYAAWYECSTLTTFPALDMSSGTSFTYTWGQCFALTTFPANMFDNTANGSFGQAWLNCALTAQSIENILVSLVASGATSKPLAINGGANAGKSTWSPAAVTAYDTLITRSWTIAFNA